MSLTAIAFLVSFAVGCLLAFTRHPIFGLITYVAVFYLHPPGRWWGLPIAGGRWALVAGLVTLLALFLRGRKTSGPPLLKDGFFIGMVLFILWLAMQWAWAMEPELHLILLILYAKYGILILLISKCIENEAHLKMFLWTHVAGCFYLGSLVYSRYQGGRFEGFGAPGIDDANSGAIQVVTGLLVAASLFLAARWKERTVLFGMIPFILNALVATISRSGFLAFGTGGVIFNYFTPKKFRKWVRVLSVLGLILFILLTNPLYWARIASLKYAGEEVEGMDTGTSRLVIIQAQWKMFEGHPLGCGHRCTATLSPSYLEDKYLTGEGEGRARSSHSTYMTMLVEHGIPGAIFSVFFVFWVIRRLHQLYAELRHDDGFLGQIFPSVAAVLGAILIGDFFVDFMKLEVRLWFAALLIPMLNLASDPKRRTPLDDRV